jgi:hypothetical protein
MRLEYMERYYLDPVKSSCEDVHQPSGSIIDRKFITEISD